MSGTVLASVSCHTFRRSTWPGIPLSLWALHRLFESKQLPEFAKLVNLILYAADLDTGDESDAECRWFVRRMVTDNVE